MFCIFILIFGYAFSLPFPFTLSSKGMFFVCSNSGQATDGAWELPDCLGVFYK